MSHPNSVKDLTILFFIRASKALILSTRTWRSTAVSVSVSNFIFTFYFHLLCCSVSQWFLPRKPATRKGKKKAKVAKLFVEVDDKLKKKDLLGTSRRFAGQDEEKKKG